jgi:hypothetical protein
MQLIAYVNKLPQQQKMKLGYSSTSVAVVPCQLDPIPAVQPKQ